MFPAENRSHRVGRVDNEKVFGVLVDEGFHVSQVHFEILILKQTIGSRIYSQSLSHFRVERIAELRHEDVVSFLAERNQTVQEAHVGTTRYDYVVGNRLRSLRKMPDDGLLGRLVASRTDVPVVVDIVNTLLQFLVACISTNVPSGGIFM